VVECDGVCLDRHSGKFALAVHVPPEHRGILTDENICLIRFHLQTDLLAQDE
jgi:hypothetical protein